MNLIDHKTNPANDELDIDVLDEPHSSGAHHAYSISGFDLSTNESALDDDGDMIAAFDRCIIVFQDGPTKEVGINGITHEALLAILIHRLQCFQNGPYACSHNLDSVSHCQEALKSLKARTADREERGVEGTHAL